MGLEPLSLTITRSRWREREGSNWGCESEEETRGGEEVWREMRDGERKNPNSRNGLGEAMVKDWQFHECKRLIHFSSLFHNNVLYLYLFLSLSPSHFGLWLDHFSFCWNREPLRDLTHRHGPPRHRGIKPHQIWTHLVVVFPRQNSGAKHRQTGKALFSRPVDQHLRFTV